MGSNAYKFSVVIPVYQIEKYLEQAVDSVVGQTIGFEENIQLIFVNDGSRDGSEAICLRYQERFPDNVTYVWQENAGVSVARNTGLAHVRGEYVNLLDGDDMWEPDAFATFSAFFAENPDVDVAAARIRFFDARDDYHPIDYKFIEGDDLVDINAAPNRVHMHVSSAFIRRSAIGTRTFDPRLRYAEDFAFIAPLIMATGVYGALSGVTYRYRRRSAKDSAINLSMRSRAWYFDTLQYCHTMLFDLSISEYGHVLLWLQHCVMYDLQVRLRTRLSSDLTAEEIDRYKALIANLLRHIEDDVIFSQRNIFLENKLYAFALKDGTTVEGLRRSLRLEKGSVYRGDLKIRNLHTLQKIVIEFLEFEGDSLRIEGHVTSVIEQPSISIVFAARGQRVEADLIHRPERRRYSLGEPINDAVGFVAVIPLQKSQTIKPLLTLRGTKIKPFLAFGRFARLTMSMETSYFAHGDWFGSVNQDGKSFNIHRDRGRLAELRRERLYLKELAEKGRQELARYRVLRFLLKPLLFGRKVWMISDRITVAGDNGEAFFRYAQKNPSRRVLPYFSLSRASRDYPRLSRVGKVVAHDSFKHRLLMLIADAVISSAIDEYVTSPFGDDDEYMKNLYDFNFVCLHHGIVQSDQSRWLNKYNKNIRIDVTSAYPEHESILHGDYHYTEREVKLTGMPRHDSLLALNVPAENTLLVMPTWRKPLAGQLDWSTGHRAHFPGFRESEYFRFYNSLINDARVLDALKKHGFTLKFVLHPALIQEAESFSTNEFVTVEQDCDYGRELQSARLMVTDYSSVSFDFALLRKPVIYAQFDRRVIEASHIGDPGYFDYERDGFGPVCADYEQTVSAIVEALVGGCMMDEMYKARAAAFFYRPETSSCATIYREILEA